MTLISDLEAAVEKVAAAVKDIDGEALAEARRLLAAAKSAESQAVILAVNYKAEILAFAKAYGPEVTAFLAAELDKLAGEVAGLFQA